MLSKSHKNFSNPVYQNTLLREVKKQLAEVERRLGETRSFVTSRLTYRKYFRVFDGTDQIQLDKLVQEIKSEKVLKMAKLHLKLKGARDILLKQISDLEGKIAA